MSTCSDLLLTYNGTSLINNDLLRLFVFWVLYLGWHVRMQLEMTKTVAFTSKFWPEDIISTHYIVVCFCGVYYGITGGSFIVW